MSAVLNNVEKRVRVNVVYLIKKRTIIEERTNCRKINWFLSRVTNLVKYFGYYFFFFYFKRFPFVTVRIISKFYFSLKNSVIMIKHFTCFTKHRFLIVSKSPFSKKRYFRLIDNLISLTLSKNSLLNLWLVTFLIWFTGLLAFLLRYSMPLLLSLCLFLFLVKCFYLMLKVFFSVFYFA